MILNLENKNGRYSIDLFLATSASDYLTQRYLMYNRDICSFRLTLHSNNGYKRSLKAMI